MAISDSLKTDLFSDAPIEQVFQKHVVDGSSYIFTKSLDNVDLEYELRHELAESLGVSIYDVIIVGSAKLGFSLKTENFKEFDSMFLSSKNPRDKSDVDIAIINRRFYDETLEQIFHLTRHFEKKWIEQNWKRNVYYNRPIDLYKKYSIYLAKGWLRPDFLPDSYSEISPWRKVSDAWYKKLQRKIAIGIYSDWTYLKHYQMDNLDRLRNKIKALEI